jgi:drug/metabolite transporter (DMT)-like permease
MPITPSAAATVPLPVIDPSAQPSAGQVSKGLFWGALGVLIFAATLPMTRLAVGDTTAPQLSPTFVTFGRAAVAALLSVLYLLAVRAPVPPRRHWPALAVSALGTVFGFPLFLSLALRRVDAMHAAVITGVLPLATAAVAAIVLRQRASPGFWACACLGCALVMAFAAWQGGGALQLADGLLLLAVGCAAIGYVAGARVSAQWPAEQVICWVLVLALPAVLPATASGDGRGLGRICLCLGVFDVARFFCLVPGPGPGRCHACQPGAAAAALSGAADRGALAGRAA